MKTLLLLRHGKSPHDGASDWERPLAKRALETDIPLIARFARERGLVPDWVVSSDARRARETATLFARCFAPVPELVLTRQLYLVSAEGIADEVQSLPDLAGTAVVVGHNMGLEQFAEVLAKGELPGPLKPGGLCVFRLAIDSWLDLRPRAATLAAFANPSSLKERGE